MIAINLTLVVQGINFFIAYCLLRAYLLRPIVDFIASKELQEKQLRAYIANKKNEILDQQNKTKDDWYSFQRKIHQSIPRLSAQKSVIFNNIKPSCEFPVISKAVVAKLTHELVATCLPKVKNVD